MRNNSALKVLFVSNSIYVFASLLLGPLYAVYVQKIGGGVLLVSISTAVFYVSSTLFLLFMARWGDRVREMELLLVASYIIRGFGFLCYIFLNSSLLLILVQVVFGLAESLGTPTFGALFAKHVDRKEEVLEYSDWAIVSNLVMALGTIVGGFIVSGLGFTFLFVTIAILCFLSAGWILFTPRKVL
jgi:MFS family permease